MASTITLSAVDNAMRPFIKQQPTSINNADPCVTIGNMVLQTILAPPFKWRWNRGTFTFPCVLVPTAQFDYSQTLADFGFIEWSWVIVPTNNDVYSLQLENALPRPSSKMGQRPTAVAAQGDNDGGVIIFRLKEIPDLAYTIEGEYQKKAPVIQSIAFTFGPVPDEFAVIFNWGYLAIASLLVNDPRFPIYEKYFIGRLLAIHGGLSSVDMNIFVGNWTAMTTAVQAANAKVPQAFNARNI